MKKFYEYHDIKSTIGLSLEDAVKGKQPELVKRILDEMDPIAKLKAIEDIITGIPYFSNVDVLKIILDQKLQYPISGYKLVSALSNALYNDKNEMVRMLISHQAVCEDGDLLIEAMQRGNVEAFHLLLEVCEDLNTEYDQYCDQAVTPLICAILKTNFDYVRAIVERGAELNRECRSKLPLDYAIKTGNNEIIEYLKSKGAQGNLDLKTNLCEHSNFSYLTGF